MTNKEVVFETFSESSSVALRAWNQLNYLRNLEDAQGDKVAEDYFNQLSDAEKQNILVLGTRILVRGEDEVYKEVIAYE